MKPMFTLNNTHSARFPHTLDMPLLLVGFLYPVFIIVTSTTSRIVAPDSRIAATVEGKTFLLCTTALSGTGKVSSGISSGEFGKLFRHNQTSLHPVCGP